MPEYEDFEAETGPPIRLPVGVRRQMAEIEEEKAKERSELVIAREKAETRLRGMQAKAMDAIEMALESEDEKIRLDAAKVWLSKVVPTVAPERAVTEEVIEVVSKATIDEVQALIEKQIRKERS